MHRIIVRQSVGLVMAGLLALATLAGCEQPAAEDEHAGLDHGDREMMAVTGWSADLEAFAEFPHLVHHEPTLLHLHLTRLPQGAPLTEGPVNLVWTHQSGGTFERVARDPEQPGIFAVTVNLPQAGLWSCEVLLPDGSQPVVFEDIHVAASVHDALHHHPPAEPQGDGVVTMAKEQQWRLGVASTPVTRQTYTQPLRVAAKVEAPPSRRIVVTSPVAGRVSLLAEKGLPILGQEVTAGEPLLAVRVPLSGSASDLLGAEADLVRANEDLQLAEAELIRATTLLEAGATSQRRVEEARSAVASARARQRAASRLLDGGDPAQTITAPIDGVIVALDASPGSFVEAGAALITVLDPSQVWVRGHIPETALEDLPARPRARLGIHGNVGEACHIEGAQLVFLAPEIDPASRSAAIVYAVDNADLHLRPGQSLGLALDTNTTADGLVIPVSALVDEHGHPVVFVQTSGDTFIKRYLTLGGQDGHQALVTAGLTSGERVVVKAPWAVKLAAKQTVQPGHGHAH